ncbi:CATION/H(+) ANTIPORTER 15-LIKE [Salix viminalis]|uniref:CATION/H(+) ANTIPORTER 15-LIKE n=1 Tax=Salix viminalis TaxID=40686 RepID=A0A9Q0TZI8_SALVM|nr:CATION/H(+) ANTIPORTER 15-LIKE [Salix viminalis]
MAEKETHDLFCHTTNSMKDFAIWRQYPVNVVDGSSALLMFQMTVISLTSNLLENFLRPLGQPTCVSQILAGMIFGPTFLGTKQEVVRFHVPYKKFVNAVDSGIIWKFILYLYNRSEGRSCNDAKARSSCDVYRLFDVLHLCAASQSFTGFPVVSAFLYDLKIQNTEVGRLALTSAVFADLIDIIVAAISLTLGDFVSHPLLPVRAVLSNIALVVVVLFIIKPMVMWMVGPIKEMKLVGEKCIFIATAVTLLLAFVSEIVGQHYVLGPLIFGLVLPNGPPFGAALVSKLSTLVCGLLYPAYLAVTGLQTNIFEVDFQSAIIVGIIVVFGIIVKMGAVMLPALHSQVPVRDALVLGMILNIKGIVEINVYNFWKDNKTLQDGDYALCIVSVILTNVVVAPLVKLLYNPSMQQYNTLTRSTIQHSKPGSELRILVCIHNRENVPTVINLLEISHATEESPIAVIGLMLVKIEGRAAPILIANSQKGVPETESSSNISIFNALRSYEQNHRNSSTVQSFTSITHFETMHDDICSLAMNKRATIVIMPFHKKWAIDGSIESTNRSIQQMNRNVLKNAPCSVGILIDRGILKGSLSVLNSRLLFNVAVLFFGGPDDAESLAYASRMVRHDCVKITVVNFLLFGNANSKERKRDGDLINEYRQRNLGNQKFMYFEEVVRDGVELGGCLTKMVGCFDLILVGKYHQKSPLFTGLEEWNECPELGVIGDMLASPDFECAASVLVIHQPRMRVSETEPLVHDAPDDNSVCISMERRNQRMF